MIGAIMVKKKVKQGFGYLMNGHIDDFLELWHPDSVLTYPGNLKISGQIIGIAEIHQWFEYFVEQFPTRKFTLERICLENGLALGPNNVAMVQWTVDLVNKDGKEYRNFGTSVLVIEKGKVKSEKIYLRYMDTLAEGWGEE